MNVIKLNVGKSVACADCVAEKDRKLCKSLPACFGSEPKKGALVNYVFKAANAVLS
jgi:hypothetical protein